MFFSDGVYGLANQNSRVLEPTRLTFSLLFFFIHFAAWLACPPVSCSHLLWTYSWIRTIGSFQRLLRDIRYVVIMTGNQTLVKWGKLNLIAMTFQRFDTSDQALTLTSCSFSSVLRKRVYPAIIIVIASIV